MTRQYFDEQIINIANQLTDENAREAEKQVIAREIATQDIAGGQAIVYGKKVSFASRELLGGQVQITLPQEWSDLSPDAVKLKYPYESRPSIILSDVSTSINFTVNHITSSLNPEYITPFINSIKMMTAKVAKLQFLEDGLVQNEENGLSIGWYDFISSAIDEDIYNFVFITPLAQTPLILTFNCLAKHQERWKPIALAMMNTLQLKVQAANRKGGITK